MLINIEPSGMKTSHSRRRSRLLALGAGGLALSACASTDELATRDLGNTSARIVPPTEPARGGDRTPVVLPSGAIDPFVEGRWVGRAEDLFGASAPNGERPIYSFPSGSSDITLELELNTSISAVGGSIAFGSGVLPAPLPAVAYPPGFSASMALGGSYIAPDVPLPAFEGFSYSLRESVYRTSEDVGPTAGAIAVGYAPNEIYANWCPLQTPRPLGNGGFDCSSPAPPGADVSCSTIDEDGTEEHFDCDLLNLCQARNICDCTETGCELAFTPSHHLWLIRDGEDLLGTFVGAIFDYGNPSRFLPIGTVRFQRVQQ